MNSKYRKLLATLLPQTSDYEILEFIECNGGQFINTHIVPTSTTELYVDCQSISFTTMFVAGSRVAFNDRMFCLADNYYGTQGWLFQIGNSFYDSESGYPEILFGDRVHLSLKVSGSSINENPIDYNFNFVETDLEIYLGGLNQNNTIEGRNYQGRIYKCIIKENDSVVRFLLPVKRNSDNVIGFLDTINNQFYPNEGIGSFTAGYYINTTIYEELQWIEATGSQYIDLELSNLGDYIIVDNFWITSATSGFLFGGRTNFNNSLVFYHNNGNSYYTAYGGGSSLRSMNTNLNDWNVIVFERELLFTNKVLYEQSGKTLIPETEEAPIYFCTTSNEGVAEPRMFIGRKGRFTILDKATLSTLTDLVPVRVRVTGEVGMFDCIRNRFFKSNGDAFIAGELRSN